jgi:hypothetical protein
MTITDRAAGFAAIGFVSTVLALNVAENVGSSRPDPTAGVDEVVAWATDAEGYAVVATILVPIAWILLAVFASAVIARGRRHGTDPAWMALGALGVAMTVGVLSGAVAADAVAIAYLDEIGDAGVRQLTGLSTALYLMNWLALAVALLGLSRTTRGVGLTPRWLAHTATVGVALLVLGSVQSGIVLLGTLPGLLVGLAGFACWLLYVLVTGIRLLRRPTPSIAAA